MALMKIHKVTNCTSVSRYNSTNAHVGGSDIKGHRNGTMSLELRRESKEIDRKGALDILDPCLRRDDIKGSRDDN